MNNLPPIGHLVQHDHAPVQKAGFVIKMEGCDCHVSEALEVEIGRPQVHVGRLGPISANLGKHLLEVCLDLGVSLCATGKAAWIEDGGIIGKETAEPVPVEIVECLDETLESRLRSGVCHFWARPGKSGLQEQQKKNQKVFHTLFLQKTKFSAGSAILA